MSALCFVVMPFGRKLDDSGRLLDFDQIYSRIIRPACALAGMDPIRADEEVAGGFIHKPMFERLMLCDYAIADLTTANANVFYELGVRHGIRPHSTVLVFGKGMRLPFDVAPLRGIPYQLDADGVPSAVDEDVQIVAKRLLACRDPNVETDSPLFQLVDMWPRPDIARLKTEHFRKVVDYSKQKSDIAAAREGGATALIALEARILANEPDPGIMMDLFLSYRAVSAWASMASLVAFMPKALATTPLVKEQHALALNRLGRRSEAANILEQMIADRGASSETNGILGRVYKDRWQDALARGEVVPARAYLKKAIAAYVGGFEADWRDAYPGVNAVMLMSCEDPPNARLPELLPIVRYAATMRMKRATADYWDNATLLELSVVANDQPGAQTALEGALASGKEVWQVDSTLSNLRILRAARERQGAICEWIVEIESELQRARSP